MNFPKQELPKYRNLMADNLVLIYVKSKQIAYNYMGLTHSFHEIKNIPLIYIILYITM